MKKDDFTESEAQRELNIKKDLPVKNVMADSVRNSPNSTPGLNEDKITNDDRLPSDGDILTNNS